MHQSVPGDRQLHRYAVALVVAHYLNGQAHRYPCCGAGPRVSSSACWAL